MDFQSKNVFVFINSRSFHKEFITPDPRGHNFWFYLTQPLYDIPGKTVGLVGLGRIGSTFACKLLGLGCKVVFFDPYVTTEVALEVLQQQAASCNLHLVSSHLAQITPRDTARVIRKIGSLEELLKMSDFVSLHIPLSPSTANLIGKHELSCMKSSAFLINTARGGVVDQQALVEALERRTIAGAAIDVYAEEPPPKNVRHRLAALDNVVCTLHHGWYTEEAKNMRERLVAKTVALVLQGKPCTNVLNSNASKL